MNHPKQYFLFLLLLSLSANMYSQIDYDSIAVDMGYLLQENFDYNEKELFEEKFNNEVFVEYIDVKKAEGNKKIEDFNAGFKSENFGSLMFEKIQTAITDETTYVFVNYSVDELKNLYLIFRLYSVTGGINYHQYLCEPSGIGEYKITDVYFFLSGEYVSQTLKTSYYNALDLIEYDDKDNNPSETFKNLFVMARVRKMIDGGNIEKARKIFFRDISEEERKKKEYIFVEMELTDIEDNEAYKDLTKRLVGFAENGNPAFYLTAIDFYYMNEQYQEVINVVDSLYSYTGDEFLEIYKANSYLELGDTISAEASMIKANEYYPRMNDTYDVLMYFYETRNEIPKFLNVLDSMRKYLKIDVKNLAVNMPIEYPEMVVTDTYKEWIELRMADRTHTADSLSNILKGKWIFDHMEDFEGNTIETSEYWDGDYGKTRPDFGFQKENFSCHFGQELYDEGTWDFDFGYRTIDFRCPFEKRSAEGKEIIEDGNFVVVDGEHIETYSYYYYSIDEDILKLFDVINGLIVYKKQK